MAAHSNNAMHGESVLAVDGQNIYFYFDRKKESPILNNVNIAVKRGTIYSLLGPSGCGKTTLLKCIVGQHKPQAGSLKIYGRSPGSKGSFIPGRGVGYMPQDLALYTEMSIEEILMFFGSLYGMSMRNIRERINFLVDLLELPHQEKLIQHLSGGQQRRVSFAIALIHKPPLLLLDEPTVGVDPLLRKAIWDHLVILTKKEHLSVVLTTHYTEEARQAHTIGIMRNGHLLLERNPEVLIKMCGGFNLEDVFLKACREIHKHEEDHETSVDQFIADRNPGPECLALNGVVSGEEITDGSCATTLKFVSKDDGILIRRSNLFDNTISLLPLPSLPTESDQVISSPTNCRMRLLCLTRKQFLQMKRNIFLMMYTVVIVAVEMTLFLLAISSNPFDLEVAVVNEEEGLNKFGEKFLLSLNNRTICKKPFRNFTLAQESLEKGESVAVLHINSEFSVCLADRVFEGLETTNDTIMCSRIKVIVDMSNYYIASTILKTVWESYQVFAGDALKAAGANPLLGEIPLDVEEYSHGSIPATAGEGAVPAVMLSLIYLVCVGLTEMSIIAEKKLGLLGRTLAAGATTTEVMLSYFIALLVIMFLQIGIMLLVTFRAFNLPCNGSVFWVILAITLVGICGMSFGFLISTITEDENAAVLIGLGSFFPCLLICGGFYPLECMPHYVRYISSCLPQTRIIDSVRSVMIKGWSMTDNNGWDGCLICSAWTVAQIMLSMILLKIRK